MRYLNLSIILLSGRITTGMIERKIRATISFDNDGIFHHCAPSFRPWVVWAGEGKTPTLILSFPSLQHI